MDVVDEQHTKKFEIWIKKINISKNNVCMCFYTVYILYIYCVVGIFTHTLQIYSATALDGI